MSRWLAAAACLALLAVPAAGAAQETEPKEPAQRVLERLRTRRSPAPADTPRAPGAQPQRAQPRAPAAPPPAMDSIAGVLLNLPGYTPTRYRGDAVHFQADTGVIGLSGKSEVARTGQQITADSLLTYDLEAAVVCGYGNPVVTGAEAGAPVASQQVCYDVERQFGTAAAARTQFSQTATWYVQGDTVYTVGTDRIFAHDARFTDCDLEVPHYHFSAAEVKISENDVLVARDVTLNFRDVPVFWLPFMMQSMKQGRRSGLLTPQFGINDIARTSDGYRRRVSNIGFFWAISDHLGAEAALDWFSGNYTALAGSFQYRWLRQFLDGGMTLRRFWNEDGGTELTLASNNRWQPGERTQVVADARYTSSSEFVRRQTFNPLELNRSIDSNAAISHRFDWGSVNLGAQRRQYISDDKVELKLPSASISLQPITLFASGGGEAAWYEDATWTGSGTFSDFSTDVDELLPGPAVRDRDDLTGSVTSQLSMGNLALSQNVAFNRSQLQPKPAVDADSARALAEDERVEWSSSLSYQQRLMGNSTLTPAVTVRGSRRRMTELGDQTFTSPMKLDFSTTARTDIFGFWPGVGPYSRLRHRLSPSITYSYSPEATADSLQRLAFSGSAADVRAQNRLQITLSQTIEAKHTSPDSVRNEAEPETTSADGEPRRLPQDRKTMLLSLSTQAIAYDFVRAGEDTLGNVLPGLETTQLSNTISSDLLRGLSLSVTHDLFETEATGTGSVQATRRSRFAPHLSRLNASFSISSESWLLRLLGMGRGDKVGTPLPQADTSATAAAEFGQTPRVPAGEQYGIIGRQVEPAGGTARGSVGTWSAQLNYTLARPRAPMLAPGAVPPASTTDASNQMVRGSVRMQPTEKWSVAWNSAYSLSEGEFADHILTLSRDLHEWQANFDFLKAQNGNFSFQFRVQLRSAPDLKVEYEQRGQRATGR